MAAQVCQRCKQLWPSFCSAASCSLIMNVKKLVTSVNYMRCHHNSFGVSTLYEASGLIEVAERTCRQALSSMQANKKEKKSSSFSATIKGASSGSSPEQCVGNLLCTVYPWWGFSQEVGGSRAYLCWCQGPYANHVMAHVP